MKNAKKHLEKLIKEEIKKLLAENDDRAGEAYGESSYGDDYADRLAKKGLNRTAPLPKKGEWDDLSAYIRQEIARWSSNLVDGLQGLVKRIEVLEDKNNPRG
jgi:uncharacterized protein YdaT